MKTLLTTYCLTFAVLLGSVGMSSGTEPPASQLENIEDCSKDNLNSYRPGLDHSGSIYVFDRYIGPISEYQYLYNAKKYAIEYHARIALAKFLAHEVSIVDGVQIVQIPSDPFLPKFKKKYFCKFIKDDIIKYRFMGRI